MDDELLNKVNQIRVWKPDINITIDNPVGLRLIGQGKQGAVFQLDEKRCVKIYYQKKNCKRELHALKLGNKAGICPYIHFWGSHYIVMEYLTSPSLFDYLKVNGMSMKLAEKIVMLLDTFAEVGFNRFDHSARHIFVMPGEDLKIIDVVHVIKSTPSTFPLKLLSDMGDSAADFLTYVSKISPDWYDIWVNHDDFERLRLKL